jgi:hypothetical protein
MNSACFIEHILRPIARGMSPRCPSGLPEGVATFGQEQGAQFTSDNSRPRVAQLQETRPSSLFAGHNTL